MKVFHLVYAEPIGPSFIAYLEPPVVPQSRGLLLQHHYEEVELTKLTEEFAQHVVRQRETSGNEPHNCMLEVRKK